MTKRKLIGKYSSLAAREAIYEAPDGFEVETRAGYDVIERRVLFDDVLFVTYHRHYGFVYLIITGLLSAFFIAIAVAILATGSDEAWIGAVVCAVIGSPAIISFLLRLMFGVEMITIFGRRSKAAIGFRVRKAHARAVYGHICALVRAAQQARATRPDPPPSAPEEPAPSAPEDRPDDVSGTLPV